MFVKSAVMRTILLTRPILMLYGHAKGERPVYYEEKGKEKKKERGGRKEYRRRKSNCCRKLI